MSEKLKSAERLAREAHRGQVDKLGVDYINHAKSVAMAVRPLGEEYEIAAWLHDSLEDCPDRDLVSPELICELFGAKVAHAVDCITKRPGEPYVSGYLRRVRSDEIAAAVKIADVRHNMSRLDLLEDASTKLGLEGKYRKALNTLRSEGAGS